METLGGYALSDFLMFSPASYFRRYELANADLWPVQLLLPVVTVALLWSMRRPQPRSGLWIALFLAAAWILAAWGFLHRHYAQINFAADWFALVFLLQALALTACGISKACRQPVVDRSPVRVGHPGMLLLLYALLVHPLVGILADRSWRGVELFGVSPDPTALATIAILLTGSLASTWPLLVIPLVWCGISALTFLAMGHSYGVAPLGVAILALVAHMLLNYVNRSRRSA